MEMADRSRPAACRRRERIVRDEPEEAAKVEARTSNDEEKLAELIASKRGRLAALEQEHEEYKRVRAHLGDLMSHNRDELQRTALEIEGLEKLQHAATLIRQSIELG
jgi:predicted  nucleic acid-binding Zn-ribbon protein